MENNTYKNGQIISEEKGNRLTYYYKNGRIKASGVFKDGLMQGEWLFYRETGHLSQVGGFKDSMKHGHFVRYDRQNNVEYDAHFAEGKIVMKKYVENTFGMVALNFPIAISLAIDPGMP